MKTSIQFRSEQGSVLVTVLTMVVVLLIISGSILETVSQEYKLSKRSLAWNQSLSTAETGVELGWNELNKLTAINSNGVFHVGGGIWTESPVGVFTSTVQTMTPTVGSEFATTYQVVLNTNTWTITSKGTANSAMMNGKPVSRTVVVAVNPVTPFEWAMLAKGQITFSGTNPTVDSWNSVQNGAYNESTNRRSNGTIGSNGVLIEAAGSEIYGSVMTGPGGVVTTSPGFNQYSDSSTRNGTNTITDGLEVYIPDVSAPWVYGSSGVTVLADNVAQTINVTGGGTVQYEMDNVTKDVTFTGTGTIVLYINSASQTGNDDLIITPASTGSLKIIIFSNGDAKFTGNSGINPPPGTPQDLLIYGLNGCTKVDIGGNSATSAAIYAPHAAVDVGGTADYFGSVVGSSIKVNGSVNFHYDESMDTAGKILGFALVSWRESQ